MVRQVNTNIQKTTQRRWRGRSLLTRIRAGKEAEREMESNLQGGEGWMQGSVQRHSGTWMRGCRSGVFITET